jgi:predicted O-methyltransferase YrrM
MDLVPDAMRPVMRRLQERDARDRVDGTPQSHRLRAITPDVGQLLLTLALAVGARRIVEVGTSGGYSTLWLALAAQRTSGRVTTFEIDPAKVALAASTFSDAGVAGVVDLRAEDAAVGLRAFAQDVDLVFIDAEKRDYETYLDLAVVALRPGGLLVADNLTSHAADLEGFRRKALAHARLSSVVIPMGNGELVAVRLPD